MISAKPLIMRLLASFFFALLACLPASYATTVDWSTLTWTPGSLTNSYDVDPGSAGNDATVTISGDTSRLQPVGGQPTPQITTNLQGGFGAGHSSLQMALQVNNSSEAVTITVDFSALYAIGVAYVSFNLFDIDYSDQGGNKGYQDQIRSITATSTTGTLLAPTITGVGSSLSLTGTGLTQVLTGMVSTPDTGASSANGNATITFNTTDIRSITFTYSNTNAFSNPQYQHIGLDNLTYQVVPEFNPTWVTIVLCGGLLCVSTRQQLVKQRRTRKRCSSNPPDTLSRG